MTDDTTEIEEIELIAREYDCEKKCGGCGYRTPVLWNIGEDEAEQLAVCASCTTRHLANTNAYTITRRDENSTN